MWQLEKNKWTPNLKYDVELNGTLKEDFVKAGENISEQTKITYDNLMRKISNYEATFKDGKDIYTYTRDEIMDMLSIFNSSSANTLNVYVSIIRQYIGLAIERRYVKTNINVANNITLENLVELVNKTKKDKKLITRELFYNKVEETIVNYSEQASLLLCFEGIRGKDNCELQNLKNEDIDLENGTIKVVREEQEMMIPISKRLCNILFRTQLEKEYKLFNGCSTMKQGGGTRDLLSVENTPYFFRPTSGRAGNGYITGKVIQARIIRCCGYLEMPFMTPSSIYLSGILHRLIEYSEQINQPLLRYTDVKEFLKQRHEQVNDYQIFSAYKDFIGIGED